MGATLTGRFETRRDAEMAVERLVQEHGIERTDIFIAAAGDRNTAGEVASGSDTRAGGLSPEGRHDAKLNGAIEVSVDLQDKTRATIIREAFSEFDGHDVEER